MYIPTIDLNLMLDSIPFLLSGLGYTLGISLAAFFLGNVLGISMTVLGFIPWRPIKLFVRFYLSFLRGTPALVLLFLLYFGLPYQLNAVVAAIICFSLTSSAYIGEIYRGSIAGVNPGQWDAAYALGNRFFPTMRFINFTSSSENICASSEQCRNGSTKGNISGGNDYGTRYFSKS